MPWILGIALLVSAVVFVVYNVRFSFSQQTPPQSSSKRPGSTAVARALCSGKCPVLSGVPGPIAAYAAAILVVGVESLCLAACVLAALIPVFVALFATGLCLSWAIFVVTPYLLVGSSILAGVLGVSMAVLTAVWIILEICPARAYMLIIRLCVCAPAVVPSFCSLLLEIRGPVQRGDR